MRLFRRVSSWLRTQSSDGSTPIPSPAEGAARVDPEILDYRESDAPDPTQESLDRALSGACKVRVIRGGTDAEGPIGDETLCETHDPGALASLKEALRIVDGPAGHCMCHGDPTIEFLARGGERLAVIAVHHGESIRWVGWKEDAELENGERLLAWLAFHGVAYPLEEYRQSRSSAEAQSAALTRWQEVMPFCLRPFSNHIAQEMSELGRVTDIAPLQRAIESTHPDAGERALVLFDWFGRGLGPWSGFPAYESLAESLLMRIPISDIRRALDSPNLSEAKLEGAARFLAGWEFRSQRRSELAQLPETTKHRLLHHIQESTHTPPSHAKSSSEDKLARARAAFEPGEALDRAGPR